MSVRHNLRWMGVSQATFFALQFGGSVLLARMLTPREMGIYALALSISGLIGLIQSLGLNELVVSERELTPSLLSSIVTVNAVLGALISTGVLTLAYAGSAFLAEPGVRKVLIVTAFLPLFGAIEFPVSALLQREARFREIAQSNMGRQTVSTVVAVLLAFRGFSYMSMAYGNIVGAIVGIIYLYCVARLQYRPRLSLSDWRRIARFGFDMIAISGVSALVTRASELIMGRLLGLSTLGIYGRASFLNNLLWDNVHLVVGRVMMPNFSEHCRAGRSLQQPYLNATAIITGVLWPAFLGLAVLSGPLVYTIYGARWIAAALPLSLLSVSAIPLVAITMTWELFIAHGETGRQAKLEFIRSGVALILFAGGCTISMAAAASARVIQSIFTFGFYGPHVRRMTKTHINDFMPVYTASALLTVAGVSPSAVLMFLYHGSPATPFGLVVLSVVIGVSLWTIVALRIDHPLNVELRRAAMELRFG